LYSGLICGDFKITLIDLLHRHYNIGNWETLCYFRNKPKKGFGFIKNGYLFMIAGISYAILHVVNAPILDQPIIPGQLAVAGGITASGIVLNRIHKNTVKLGKKHYLQYIPLK
jgi:hypothetical protein